MGRGHNGYVVAALCIPIAYDFLSLKNKFKLCFYGRLSLGGEARRQLPQSSVLSWGRGLGGGVRGGGSGSGKRI